MGVQGLWTLIEPCGRRVNIEALTNKRLAVGTHSIRRQIILSRYSCTSSIHSRKIHPAILDNPMMIGKNLRCINRAQGLQGPSFLSRTHVVTCIKIELFMA
jgi:hypothetical protein